jgi:hypothetical protein
LGSTLGLQAYFRFSSHGKIAAGEMGRLLQLVNNLKKKPAIAGFNLFPRPVCLNELCRTYIFYIFFIVKVNELIKRLK